MNLVHWENVGKPPKNVSGLGSSGNNWKKGASLKRSAESDVPRLALYTGCNPLSEGAGIAVPYGSKSAALEIRAVKPSRQCNLSITETGGKGPGRVRHERGGGQGMKKGYEDAGQGTNIFLHSSPKHETQKQGGFRGGGGTRMPRKATKKM